MLGSIFLIVLILLGIFIVIIFLWLFFALGNFPQRQEDPYKIMRQIQESTEQEDITELHKQAFVYNDFDALQALVRKFGGAVEYWENRPDLAPLLAQAVKKLAERVETGDAPREAKLEDFYYLGLMYEQGFECEPDLEEALYYFEEALDTETCWSGLEDENELFRAQVSKKIRDINQFFLQRQMRENNSN